jgi:hypothetical protein
MTEKPTKITLSRDGHLVCTMEWPTHIRIPAEGEIINQANTGEYWRVIEVTWKYYISDTANEHGITRNHDVYVELGVVRQTSTFGAYTALHTSDGEE